MEWRQTVTKFLLIGLGGFVGAVSRYAVGGVVQNVSKSIAFPYGTIAVNVIGCFLIGSLAYLAETRSLFSANTRMFLFIGVLGAFTTFSTFANETLELLRGNNQGLALLNIAAHFLLCISAVVAGRYASLLIWR
jgi:CrcB protein